MKEIVENANENGDSILPKMPLINLGRSNSVLNNKSSSNTIFNQSHHRKLINIIGKNVPPLGSTSRLSVDLKIN